MLECVSTTQAMSDGGTQEKTQDELAGNRVELISVPRKINILNISHVSGIGRKGLGSHEGRYVEPSGAKCYPWCTVRTKSTSLVKVERTS